MMKLWCGCRDLAELGNRMNLQRAMMGRDEVEARKAEMLRKRENDRRTEGYTHKKHYYLLHSEKGMLFDLINICFV